MAMTYAIVRLEFEPVDPDGSECMACGDRCFLTMWQLVIVNCSNSKKARMDKMLCGSCHEMIMGGEE